MKQSTFYVHLVSGDIATAEDWKTDFDSMDRETWFGEPIEECKDKDWLNDQENLMEVFTAEYNEDLDGYVLTFVSGRCAHTQFDTESNKLHADFGDRYLTRYTEYDDELVENEDGLAFQFVDYINGNNIDPKSSS